MELSDKEKIKPLELIINKLFKKDFSIKYNKEFNHRTYITATLNRKMKQIEKSLLPNKIKAEQYHTEVIEQDSIFL